MPGGGSNASAEASAVQEVQIPNFLVKVWNILEDDAYKDSIHWDDSGFSFHIADPLRFSKEVLPLFFKHNNLSSFVRQLNMYGFRKVTPLEKTGLSRAQSDQEHLEFQHAYFVQGHPELLQYIKRKSGSGTGGGGTSSSGRESAGAVPRGLESVLDEIKRLRERQMDWDSKLDNVKKENGTLWRELTHMRSSHMKQQQIVTKLIQFLLSVVPNSTAAASVATGKQLPKRLLLAIGANDDTDDDGPGSSKRQSLRYSKRPRTAAKAGGSAGVPSFLSSPGASASLEALQQELQNSAPMPRAMHRGPIIAEVTDDADDDMSPPVHSVSSPAPLNSPSPPVPSTRVQPPRTRKRTSMGKQVTSPASSTMSPSSTNPMLMDPGHNYSAAPPTAEPRLQWNVPPPPPTIATQPPRGGGGPVPPHPAGTQRSVSGQEFNDFLAFMDMDMKSLRSNLANVQQEEGGETIDQSFLDTLFNDLPAVSSGAPGPSAEDPAKTLQTAYPPTSNGGGGGAQLSLTAGPAATEEAEPLFEGTPPQAHNVPQATPLDDFFDGATLNTPKPLTRRSTSSSTGSSGTKLSALASPALTNAGLTPTAFAPPTSSNHHAPTQPSALAAHAQPYPPAQRRGKGKRAQ